MIARSIFILMLSLSVLIPSVNAAPLSPFYNMDYSGGTGYLLTDQIYLFISDKDAGSVSFQGWDRDPYSHGFLWFFGSVDWSPGVVEANRLSASGDVFDSGYWYRGNFEVNVSDSQIPFNLEYAFLLNGEVVGAGTGYWDGSQWAAWDASFNNWDNLHTPISGTVWLMASGILALVGIRRRKSMKI